MGDPNEDIIEEEEEEEDEEIDGGKTASPAVFDQTYFDDPGGVLKGYNEDYQGYLEDDEGDQTWDAMAERFFHILENVDVIRDGMTILDVGCARGYFGKAVEDVFLEHGYHASVFGLDVSEYIIRTACPGTHLMLCSASDISSERLKAAGFPVRYDVVCSFLTLQHLSLDDMGAAVYRIMQVVDKLIYLELAVPSLQKETEFLNHYDPETILEPHGPPDPHSNVFSSEIWRDTIKDNLHLFWQTEVTEPGKVYSDPLRRICSVTVRHRVPRYLFQDWGDIRIRTVDYIGGKLPFQTHPMYTPSGVQAVLDMGYHTFLEVYRGSKLLLAYPHYKHELLARGPSLVSCQPTPSSSRMWQWFAPDVDSLIDGVDILRQLRDKQTWNVEFDDRDDPSYNVCGTFFNIGIHLLPHQDLIARFGTTPYIFKNFSTPITRTFPSFEEFANSYPSKKAWKWRNAKKVHDEMGWYYGDPLPWRMLPVEAYASIRKWFDLFEDPIPTIGNPWFELNFRLLGHSAQYCRDLGREQDNMLCFPVYAPDGELFGVDIFIRLYGKLWERLWFAHNTLTDRKKYQPGRFFCWSAAVALHKYGVLAYSHGGEDVEDGVWNDKDIGTYYKYTYSHYDMMCCGVNSDPHYGVPDRSEITNVDMDQFGKD